MGDHRVPVPGKKLSGDLISQRYAQGLRTYIITLKFPDLSFVERDTIARIGYGGDLWEFRVDLLKSQPGQPGIPSLQFVRKQLQTLRHLSDLPILFTVRTVSQGGNFPDGAEKEALPLIRLALELECEYIDVEISWMEDIIKSVQSMKGRSRIVASDHVFKASMKWTSQELHEKCLKAEAIGDIVKLCVQAEDINDSLELGLYVRDYEKRMRKPMIAVAMGQHGQLSRFTAPVTFVTHRLIPQPPGSDQLTLIDINHALRLLGQLPKRTFFLSGLDNFHSCFSKLLEPAFEELGFPYGFFGAGQSLEEIIGRPDFGGACIQRDNLQIRKLVHGFSEPAKEIGSIDVVSVSIDSGERRLQGDNMTWATIRACIDKSPIGSTSAAVAAVIIGAGDNARAACYAVARLGFQSVVIISDAEEQANALVSTYQDSRGTYERASSMANLNVMLQSVVIACSEHHLLSQEIIEDVSNLHGSVFLELEPSVHSRQFREAAQNQPHWVVFTAEDILKERAFLQFQAWTGRRAPELVLDTALKIQNLKI